VDLRQSLQSDLQEAREALIWKLEGLSEYAIRRPMVPTGTNLLGLVKHVAIMEAGYLGATFGRPIEKLESWFQEDAEVNADMWARADETRADIVGLYREVWQHSDATIDILGLDAEGKVPWWGGSDPVTLLRILVYVIAETNRHAGHADILRELLDGGAGWRRDDASMAPGDEAWWRSYRDRLEEVARQASDG
jgi:uncharacterized damage-inducible protein DinB